MNNTVSQLSRRSFFTSAASGLGLAALASLMKDDGVLAADSNRQSPIENRQLEDPLRPKAPHFPARAKACIFIYLIGGVSHIDLFDPKPALDKLDGQPIPESFRQGIRLGQTSWKFPLMRSKFQFTRHGQCGMELSELIPHIGSVADDIALIRSMHHQAFDHAPGEIMTTAGKDIPGRPSIGSWLTYGLGSESQNLPGYVVMVNGRAPKSREMIHTNGFLPASHQGVLFRNDGSPILNLANPSDVTAEMHRAQLDAIHQLDKARYEETKDPAVAARIAAYELAFRMQKHAPELADMKGESKATIDSYGDGNFGRSLLLARRLVERGVRFVTVTHHEWDNHGNINEELPRACKQVDRPIATVIKDLKQRGLLDSTLVVCASEFGRTAIGQGDKTPGRDHHPHGYSVFLAGGGVRGGQVMGRTDDLGWRVTDEPVHINDFHATLLHLFGLDHKKLTYRHQGFDFRLTDVAGNVVEKLLA